MKVILSGFNIESEMIEHLSGKARGHLSPEVISAAYARISRDPRSVATLRREARESVDKARRSNERIVFGLGHSSVAEHAVFNFDIMDISRLAVEELEHFRLASYTEKSQRYIRLGRDFVIPTEIEQLGLASDLEKLQKELYEIYERILERLLGCGEDEGVAKEDARYVMPLATSAQLGMTVNARELEYMVSKLSAHELAELRDLASRLADAAQAIAPSLIRYPEPTEYTIGMPAVRREIAAVGPGKTRVPDRNVRLVEATPDGDIELATSLVFASGRCGMTDARRTAVKLGKHGRNGLIAKTFERMKPHDGVWREFERIRFVFEVIVSSSCFAQLKRHRMATILAQRYTPALGISVPGTIKHASVVSLLREGTKSAERLYRKIEKHEALVCEYALSNAHRRRVLVSMNLRELYHFSRLRSDAHAQGEIRELSDEMCRLASRRVPAGSRMLGGKDAFEEQRWHGTEK
jgi:flavin-dependent thymidylate synthase